MKSLPGQHVTEADWAPMEAQLKRVIYDLVFGPVVDLLAPHNAQVRAARAELRNAKSDPVVAALRAGRIQYDMKDTFSGEFSAAISKALRGYGARFDKRTKTFTALPQVLPLEVLKAATEYADTAKRLHDRLMERLDGMEKALGRAVQGVNLDAERVVKRTGREMEAKYGDALGLDRMEQHTVDRLAKQYVDNLKPTIRKFSGEMIAELRQIVAENAGQGYRFSTLVDKIQNRYGVAQSRAEFIAQQETSSYVSKVRAARFGEVGVTEYIWDTAGDVDVREGHKLLDGKVFDFRTKAPAQYMSCGEPCNPGEDFRCRCVARPLLPATLTGGMYASAA